MEEINKKEESIMKEVAYVLLGVYSVLIFIMIIIGVTTIGNCTHIYRFDYVFPGRKIGCWLNTEVGSGDKVDE